MCQRRVTSVNGLRHHAIAGMFCEMDLFASTVTRICVGFEYEYIVFKYKVQNSNNQLRTTMETGRVYAVQILTSLSGLFSNRIYSSAPIGLDPSVWSLGKCLFSGLFVFLCRASM